MAAIVRFTLVTGLTMCLAYVILYTPSRHSGRYRDAHNRLISSIFAPSNTEVVHTTNTGITRARDTSCSKPAGILAALGLEVSAHASNCQASSCGGHYMYAYNAIQCSQACSENYLILYMSDSWMGNYYDGTRFTGNGACPAIDSSGYCACEESTCAQ